MEPLTQTLVTILGLLSMFRQETGAREDLTHREFIEWLDNHRHEALKDLIVRTHNLPTEIDTLLRQDQQEILRGQQNFNAMLEEILARIEGGLSAKSNERALVIPTVKAFVNETLPRSNHFTIQYRVKVFNQGPKTASGLLVFFEQFPQRQSLNGFGGNWELRHGGDGQGLACLHELQPGASLLLGETRFGGLQCERVDTKWHIQQDVADVEFRFRILCNDQPPLVAKVEFHKHELVTEQSKDSQPSFQTITHR